MEQEISNLPGPQGYLFHPNEYFLQSLTLLIYCRIFKKFHFLGYVSGPSSSELLQLQFFNAALIIF